jgi:FkbM family methyltransferase
MKEIVGALDSFNACRQLLWSTPVAQVFFAFMSVNKPNLRFIQVGANDGIANDPIRWYVFKHGWHGILIEPQPVIFKQLQENYKGTEGLIFENCAISPQQKNVELYYLDESDVDWPFVNRIATLDPNKGWLAKAKERAKKVNVKSRTLNQVIEAHSMNSFDVLVIDTEGFDFEVLKTIDLTRHQPTVIVYEERHLAPPEHDQAEILLWKHGYTVFTQKFPNDTFAIHRARFNREYGL